MSTPLHFLDPSQINFKRATLTQASTTDTWTFTNKDGGVLLTIVITYTDSTKATIAYVDRTVPAAV